RRGEVARRRASHRRERPLPGLRDRDGDRAVFERVCRIDRVVLDPKFAGADRILQVPGPPQRRVARREVDNRMVVEHGKELTVSPQSGRSAAEGVALEPSTKSLDLVPDFEWPETGFTNRKLDRRIFRPAFPTLQAANVPRERPSQFSRQTERSPPVNPYGDNYSNRDNRRIRIGIDDSVVALRCAE